MPRTRSGATKSSATPKYSYQTRHLSGTAVTTTTPKRKCCHRRALIEPIISHLNVYFRLAWNVFNGTAGDIINVLLASIGFIRCQNFETRCLSMVLYGYRLPTGELPETNSVNKQFSASTK
jgi:hypothetical protein